MDEQTRTNLEAAAWRSFVGHLQKRTDVQNIDLMNLSGFCRNCLYKWLLAAAEEQGVPLSKDDAIQAVYGMSIAEWKANHQTKASEEQLKLFEDTKPLHSEISGHK
ncbi:DUF1244 domain-containing protein [Magnetovibrio blakemorei]|uniref:Alkaline phosphatase n=1 Tax=Magnetovibrio blakemorei TaxID=28181 RepID=A0A1E5Q8H0_9PROT|nr:DUF1244 domain-containing protein [Magnetovibrio blakemorei]OEJ67546.1 alkaline phosphatase [Magnetovibrio blakemorei]